MKLRHLISKFPNFRFSQFFSHASVWISKMEPQEPGIGAVGIQFEYEWPDAAKSLSEAAIPAADPSNKTQSKNE